MSYTIKDQTIALAGAYQAIILVHNIASSGNFNDADFEACIYSIFQINIDNSEDAYNGKLNIRTGLKTLIDQLGGADELSKTKSQQDINITKYLIGVMAVEKQLSKNTKMLDEIYAGILRAKTQAEHFTITHENVISNLASLYTKTISTLKPRIMVHGEQVYLSNPIQTNRIRALLLSAIRSIVLWRQCHGSRWGLLLKRRSYVESAKTLL